MNALIVYFTQTGNTEQVARAIGRGLDGAGSETVDLATRLPLEMVSVYPMMPYPAPFSYQEADQQIEFTLYPYSVRYRNGRVWEVATHRVVDLMHRIYLSLRFITAKAKWLLRYPAYSFKASLEFGRWLTGGFAGRRRKTLL